MSDLKQLAAALIVAAGCAPAKRPWPPAQDARVRFDGARLRVYGAALTTQEAADRDALEALRRYLAKAAPRAPLQAVLAEAKPRPAPTREPGAYASVIDLSRDDLQKRLGTRYD